MRMWMVPPELMCRRHLLGEHAETHMFLGTLQKGRSVAGFLSRGLLEPASLKMRHDGLAAEMEARGYRHLSPMVGEIVKKAVSTLSQADIAVQVDSKKAIVELCSRCKECFGS